MPTTSINVRLRDSGVSSGLRNISRDSTKSNRDIIKLGNGLSRVESIGRRLQGIAFTVGAGFGISEIFKTAAAYESLDLRLEAVFGSQERAAEQFEFINGLADKYALGLRNISDGYIRLSAASEGTNLQGEKTKEIFENVTKAVASQSLSLETQGRVFKAFEQILSKGTVSSEEIRQQLGDALPGAFKLAAESVGATTEEFKKMLEQGEVISEDFLPKFAKRLAESLGSNANKNILTLNGSLATLSNSWDRFIINLNQASFGEEAKNSLQSINELLNDEETAKAFIEVLSTGLKLGSQLVKVFVETLKTVGPAIAFATPIAVAFFAAFKVKNIIVDINNMVLSWANNTKSINASTAALTAYNIEAAKSLRPFNGLPTKTDPLRDISATGGRATRATRGFAAPSANANLPRGGIRNLSKNTSIELRTFEKNLGGSTKELPKFSNGIKIVNGRMTRFGAGLTNMVGGFNAAMLGLAAASIAGKYIAGKIEEYGDNIEKEANRKFGQANTAEEIATLRQQKKGGTFEENLEAVKNAQARQKAAREELKLSKERVEVETKISKEFERQQEARKENIRQMRVEINLAESFSKVNAFGGQGLEEDSRIKGFVNIAREYTGLSQKIQLENDKIRISVRDAFFQKGIVDSDLQERAENRLINEAELKRGVESLNSFRETANDLNDEFINLGKSSSEIRFNKISKGLVDEFKAGIINADQLNKRLDYTKKAIDKISTKEIKIGLKDSAINLFDSLNRTPQAIIDYRNIIKEINKLPEGENRDRLSSQAKTLAEIQLKNERENEARRTVNPATAQLFGSSNSLAAIINAQINKNNVQKPVEETNKLLRELIDSLKDTQLIETI